jgi:hypothetical protein
MRIAIILWLLSLAMLTSPKRDDRVLVHNANVSLVNTVKHAFSNPARPDVFKLTLTGTSVLKGKVTFQIISFDNKEIHKETFPATDLYGDLEEVLKPKQQTDTITSRFKHFFDKNSFHTPAISPQERYEYDVADKITWTGIKTDKAAIGFIYSHGYESSYGIAWSKKQKKVVQYFYSD